MYFHKMKKDLDLSEGCVNIQVPLACFSQNQSNALTFPSPVLLEVWSVSCLSAARKEISTEIKCTAHEKMPAIISYQGNANTSHDEIPFYTR